ncbi:MAG TPA: flavin reductase family protein [Candidatus Nitrosotalea sp.]|nr:flavin reductase family protein [Candidatus Nitrosotalea sp.]
MQDKAMQQAQKFFLTSLCLITSIGPRGQNVMAAEWTMQISYDPMLISVFIHNGSSTLENIRKTKRFGVNLASEAQATQVSVAGGYSRREIDKLNLRGLFQTYDTDSGLPMIKGCLINAECKLESIKKTGDHNMVIGRVVAIKHDKSKSPLIYHQNRYFGIGPMVEPERTKIQVRKETFDALSPQVREKFIAKIAGVLVIRNNKVLVLGGAKNGPTGLIPFTHPRKHADNKKELERYLKGLDIEIKIRPEPRIKRLAIQSKNRIQRINFVIFKGTLSGSQNSCLWKSARKDPLLRVLVR